MPKSWRLKAIIAALGIEQHSPKARELVRAYFIALSGSDELLQILSVPVSAAQDLPSRELAESATHQALARRSVHLTIEQWKLRSRDLVTHICMNFMVNTADWVTVRELEAATRFKPEAIRKALKALASGGLLEFSGGRARCPLVDKVIELPPVTPATTAVKAALRNNWNKWLADSKLVDVKRITGRLTKANLDIYRQHLEKAVNLLAIYDNAGENRQDSAVYFVDAGIFRIFPRD